MQKLRLSTWLIISSIVLTGFMAQPTFASLLVHGANVLILILVLWVAHHEH